MKQISSRMTPVMRYGLVPWVLVGAPALLCVAAIVARAPGALLAVPVWLAIFGLLLGPIWRCARVGLTDRALVVIPTGREIPFADIRDVRGSALSSPELVTVVLASGERVRFLATWRIHTPLSPPHPIVLELKRLTA